MSRPLPYRWHLDIEDVFGVGKPATTIYGVVHNRDIWRSMGQSDGLGLRSLLAPQPWISTTIEVMAVLHLHSQRLILLSLGERFSAFAIWRL